MKNVKLFEQFLNEKVSDEEVFSFLNHLRDSGKTNMFGAGAYIETEFGLDKRKARELLTKWMKSFNEGKVTEGTKEEDAIAFRIKLLLKQGARASVKDGEDKLYKLSQEFEGWNVDNDDKYDDLVDPLFAAVELIQDAGVPGTNNVEDDKEYRMYIKSAEKHLKQFNKDCAKALKGLKESKVNEGSKYTVAWSDGVRGGDEFKKESDAMKYAKDLIRNNKRLQYVSVHRPGMTQTAHREDLLAWWGPGDMWDNKAKKDKTLYDIQIEESVNEGMTSLQKKVDNEIAGMAINYYANVQNEFGIGDSNEMQEFIKNLSDRDAKTLLKQIKDKKFED